MTTTALLLLLSLGAGTALGLGLSRGTARTPPRLRPWVDVLVLAFLAVAGVLYAEYLHATANPAWLPVGQDWQDYVMRQQELLDPSFSAAAPNRYPFYPWLGLTWGRLSGWSPVIGAMQVSICAAGLLPAAAFLLGRQVAPWPVALAGALVALHLPALQEFLGPPTEYLLYTLLYVLSLGTGAAALARGGAWRFLGFGTALALLMATVPQALVVLVAAVPLAGIALAWHGWRQPRRGAFAALAFLLPLALCWETYRSVDLPIHPLEGLVYNSQVLHAREHHLQASMPTDLGWDPQLDPAQQGTWRIGGAGALRHLPTTLRFLARGTPDNIPFSWRWGTVRQGLEGQFPVGIGWSLLVVPGVLAAGSAVWSGRDRVRSAIPWVLAVALPAAATAVQAKGLLGTTWEARYALPLLVTAPVLALGGASALLRLTFRGPWRASGLPWWPLLAMVFGLLAVGPAPLGAAHVWRAAREAAQGRTVSHYYPLLRLAQTTAENTVVDLSESYWTAGFIAPRDCLLPRCAGDRVEVTAEPAGRGRYLLQPCTFAQGNPAPRWVAADSDRLVPWATCIDQDTRPAEPLTLRRVPCEGCPDAPRDGPCWRNYEN